VLEFFEATTTIPEEYIHGFDTWNGISHATYNKNIEEIALRLAEKGKLNTVEDAHKFIRWIMTGEGEKKLFEGISNLKTQASNVRSWATGFFKAEYAAEVIKAANANLTEQEVKILSKAISKGGKINDADIPKNLRPKFAALLTQLKGMETAGTLKAFALRYGKKAFKALGLVALMASAAQGATGNGHNPNLDGALGAADQLLYDSIQAEYFEWMAKSIGEAVVPLAGVADTIGVRVGRTGIPPNLEGMEGMSRGQKDPKIPPKPKKSGADRWGWPLSIFNNEE
jgi:hypothetical protein